LTGRNGEQRILVLAGTEKVYVDGALMERGETNDYIIEYASGEVYFKPRRLITNYSRITVDFEYAERQFVRSLFAANGTGEFLHDHLSLTTRFIRESDDQNSPLDQQLSEVDKRVLSDAGDDQTKASTSGISYVGIDTISGKGAGQYVRTDTTINGSSMAAYAYAPGADSALYSVYFSFVGAGRGSYVRKTVTSFQFTGPGAGDYAPIRLLPMPQVKQLGDLALTAKPFGGLSITTELAFSSLDRNTFSSLDASDNNGLAYMVTSQWQSGETSLGTFDLSGRFRESDMDFNPIDRINDIEFTRKWDYSSITKTSEVIREGTVKYVPNRQVSVTSGFGSISRGLFSSRRFDGGVSFAPDSTFGALPKTSWSFESIRSADGAATTQGSWFRQRGELGYSFPFIQPRLRLEQERRRTTAGSRDTLTPESMGFLDIRPGVSLPEFWKMTLSAEYGFRSEESYLDGRIQKQSDDILQQYGWSLRTWNDLSASASVTVRDRKYTTTFRQLRNKDLQTILTKAQVRFTPLRQAINTDLFYEVSTERTSKLERVYFKVPYGQGNYTYSGDRNTNGVQDESEFEPTRYEGDYILITLPTDQLFPVIDLRSSARIRFTPARLLATGTRNVFEDMANAISTESFLRVEEKSSDESTANIYLMRFSTFLNDTTTLRGFQNLRQDVFLFDQDPEFSMRFRFDQSRGFSQYALANERSYRRERSVRLKTQLVREIGMQSDLVSTDDDVSSSTSSNRARAISATTWTNDFSYRPFPHVEVGFVYTSKSATDSYPETPVAAEINSQTFRTSLSFDGPGRLRVELERNEVKLSQTLSTFPFELTDGRADGKSWIVRANFDYRFTSFLQANLTYLGRSEGGRSMLHTARAEVRAFF